MGRREKVVQVLITVAKEYLCQNAKLYTWTGLVKFWLRALWTNARSSRGAIESTVLAGEEWG